MENNRWRRERGGEKENVMRKRSGKKREVGGREDKMKGEGMGVGDMGGPVMKDEG